MIRTALSLSLLTLASQAHAGMLGTVVSFDFGDGAVGAIDATVLDPDVEWPCAGDLLGIPPCRLDVDVTDTTIRLDFTALADYGFGGSPDDIPWWTLDNVEPICDDGSVGTIVGVGTVTTNMETDEWIPSQVSFSDHTFQIMGNPFVLGGDDPNNIRTNIGDFIEAELLFSCGGAGPTLAYSSGTCPGPVTIDMTGYTPGGTIAVLKGSGAGAMVLPGGPCVGVGTGLAGLGLVTTFPADPFGNASVTPNLSAGACGSWLQMLDVSTCTLSSAIPIP